MLLKNIYVHSKFSWRRSSHDLRARAHTHSLEGKLVLTVAALIVFVLLLVAEAGSNTGIDIHRQH